MQDRALFDSLATRLHETYWGKETGARVSLKEGVHFADLLEGIIDNGVRTDDYGRGLTVFVESINDDEIGFDSVEYDEGLVSSIEAYFRRKIDVDGRPMLNGSRSLDSSGYIARPPYHPEYKWPSLVFVDFEPSDDPSYDGMTVFYWVALDRIEDFIKKVPIDTKGEEV